MDEVIAPCLAYFWIAHCLALARIEERIPFVLDFKKGVCGEIKFAEEQGVRFGPTYVMGGKAKLGARIAAVEVAAYAYECIGISASSWSWRNPPQRRGVRQR